MTELVDSLQFGLAVVMLLLGLIGAVLPIVPGSVLMLLTVWGYAYLDGFQAPGPWLVALLSIILLVGGSAEWWLPYFGVRSEGGSLRATLYGLIGGFVGLFFGFLFGSLLGYAIGVLLGAYQTERDWQRAWRSVLNGLKWQGAAALVELGGGLIVFFLFIWAALR